MESGSLSSERQEDLVCAYGRLAIGQEPAFDPTITDENAQWGIPEQDFSLNWEVASAQQQECLTPEEQEVAAIHLAQWTAAKSFFEFLKSLHCQEDEDDMSDIEYMSSDEESGNSEDMKEDRRSRENVAYDYFTGVLKENQELLRVYTQECSSTSLQCLVCIACGIGWKKFRDLTSLAQHAKTTLKAKKLAEHRGYGRAISDIASATQQS